jgi:antitoxin FitA
VGEPQTVDHKDQFVDFRALASIASIAVNERIHLPTLTIRDVEDDIRSRLRIRAAHHGRSMEAEVREILREALAKGPNDEKLGTRVRQRFGAIGGVELDLPPRAEMPRSVEFC